MSNVSGWFPGGEGTAVRNRSNTSDNWFGRAPVGIRVSHAASRYGQRCCLAWVQLRIQTRWSSQGDPELPRASLLSALGSDPAGMQFFRRWTKNARTALSSANQRSRYNHQARNARA